MTDAPDPLGPAIRRAAAGDPAGADAEFRVLYRADAPDPPLLHAWAQLHRRAGNLVGAGQMLRQAASIQASLPVLADLAAVCVDRGDLKEAGDLLRRATQAGRNHAAIEFQIGRLEEASGRPDAALTQYRSASRADPKHLDRRLALGRLLARTGRPEEAIGALTALQRHCVGDYVVDPVAALGVEMAEEASLDRGGAAVLRPASAPACSPRSAYRPRRP